jgi:hypothetical protein
MTARSVPLPGSPGLWSSLSLAAVRGTFNPEEIRDYWNSRDAPNLHPAKASAPSIVLGLLYAYTPDRYDVGPARRVFDALYLAGTLPFYNLPVATDEFKRQLVAAYTPRSGDVLPPATHHRTLSSFLESHRGAYLLAREAPIDELDDPFGS